MSTRTALIAVTCALSVSWLAAAHAQSAAKSGAAALTAEDRAGIEQLLARYQRALNTCASKEYSELFTPDGVFKSDDFRGGKHFELYGKSATLVGRAKLVELVETEEFCMDPKKREARVASVGGSAAGNAGGNVGGSAGGNGARPTANLALVFEVTTDGVKGTVPLGSGGRYEDVYIKTQEGWRFKSRSVVMPPATAAPAASATR